MADATLVLRLHKHSQPHIPEGLHCHLHDISLYYNQEYYVSADNKMIGIIYRKAEVQTAEVETDVHLVKTNTSTAR